MSEIHNQSYFTPLPRRIHSWVKVVEPWGNCWKFVKWSANKHKFTEYSQMIPFSFRSSTVVDRIMALVPRGLAALGTAGPGPLQWYDCQRYTKCAKRPSGSKSRYITIYTYIIYIYTVSSNNSNNFDKSPTSTFSCWVPRSQHRQLERIYILWARCSDLLPRAG